MIIRETRHSFIMIKQHDHAFLSGEITKHFDPALLNSDHHFGDAIYAAYQHDRSWIGLDETPIWNDESGIPFTFSDYPLLVKIAFYKIGLDEIEQVNPYSALLCSLHFCSFFTQSKNKNCLAFLKEEANRQEKLKQLLPDIDEELLHQHFRLLQFSDDLSLFVCLNEPGASKEDEHPWFKSGFKNTEIFHEGDQWLDACWLTEEEIKIDSFTFTSDFPLPLKFKEVLKRSVQEMGIAQAYETSVWEEKVVLVRR
ncbi:DUF3891 family protein [Mangrovibacillus sp. Mu-81]|jgi:hypothetical protein|uniref:DUF3891 family protein n=1 Tax=Mangrovibacillus sp. Mu-81 TaxID=3121478 RepID=UPI002FE45D66